jgi:small-conductance mechanosensitive channel
MDFQTQFETFREWAFHFEGATQKWVWSGIAILVGYLLGSVISRILRFIAHKLAGLGKHVEGSAQPKTADHVMIDILGALIRACFLLVALAIAANLLFNYSLDSARDLAISALKGLAILVGVWFLGSWLGSRVRKFGHNVGRKASSGGETLFNFLAALVRFGAFAVGLIAALQQFGFDTASLLAIIGAAGLAVALALQDTLKAVAAGVVIAVFRPYKIGDNVRIAGEDGKVADITPFTTVLNTIDNREVVITNDKAWGNTIVNSSVRSLRRLDILVSIDYDDDIDEAIRIITGILNDDNRVRDEPPVWVKVVDLAASSVDLRARAWVSNTDWWDLRCDTLKNIKQGFDKAGITIPYPHQVTVTKGEPHVDGPQPAAPRDAKPKAAG